MCFNDVSGLYLPAQQQLATPGMRGFFFFLFRPMFRIPFLFIPILYGSFFKIPPLSPTPTPYTTPFSLLFQFIMLTLVDSNLGLDFRLKVGPRRMTQNTNLPFWFRWIFSKCALGFVVNKWKVLVILFAKWVLLLVDLGNRPGVLKVCEKYWNYNFCDGFTLGLLSRRVIQANKRKSNSLFKNQFYSQ